MLLFQKRFWEGLQRGEITLTFRRWEKPHVKPGGRYRCHPIGVLQVDDLRLIKAGAITEDDARRAGFEDVASLKEYLSSGKDEPLRATTPVYRVTLHYGGDGDRVETALQTELSDEDCAALAARLQKLDERSETGPWTAKTLKVIGQHPRIAASKLAPKLGLETLPFKANVVKLKKLGLTQSFEVGYEISPRGQAFLERSRRRKKR